MSVHDYKQQAQRLADHFSAVHKLRLKPSRALEAIAALHGAKDWNVLHAAAIAAPEPTPVNSCAIPTATPAPGNGQGLFQQMKLSDASVAEELLRRQVLLSGGSAEQRYSSLRQLVAAQTRRGSLLFVDLAEQPLLHQFTEWVQTTSPSLRPITFDVQAASQYSVNQLEGTDEDLMANAILHALPPSKANSPGADFYRQQANWALTVLCAALLAAGERVTLIRLGHLLREPARELPLLLSQVPQGAPHQALVSFMALFSKGKPNEYPMQWQLMQERKLAGEPIESAPPLDEARLNTLLGGLVGRLAQVNTHPAFVGGMPFSWAQAFAEKTPIYVRASGPGPSELMGALVRQGLQAALGGHSPGPFTVFVAGPGAESWLRPGFLHAPRVGRGVGIVIEAAEAAVSSNDIVYCPSVCATIEKDFLGDPFLNLLETATRRRTCVALS